MSQPQVLLQYGDNPFNLKMKDLEGRLACTVEEVGRTPNPIIRLTREAPWAQQHPSIMGPDNSYYYLGPENRPGYIIYGNNRTNIPMANLMKKKSEGSSSRYFTTMGNRECKWKKGSKKMECVDGRTTLATWELSDPDDEHSAKLIIKPAGMSIVTEILTTLALNLMAQTMGWPDS
ncbi:hypothetical protein AX14_003521 [Amanita brunnescens Koide BX004]|nr:hypothetical protein AX14_003521 [Amanita brunnescens Koide BX004]